jgi:hypothetical protein
MAVPGATFGVSCHRPIWMLRRRSCRQLGHLYVGRLKGVGAVWQLTAVDMATRTAVCQLIVGDKTATVAAAFLDRLKESLRMHGITLDGILTLSVRSAGRSSNDETPHRFPAGARTGAPGRQGSGVRLARALR